MSLGEDTFERGWSVEILKQPPLIAPARQQWIDARVVAMLHVRRAIEARIS